MSIAAGIVLMVVGAILTSALKSGHLGNLDLHVVGVILMLAGVIGILLPILIRNWSRFSRPTIRSRKDVVDDGARTIVEHTDGSQTLVEHADGGQTFAQHFDAGQSPVRGRASGSGAGTTDRSDNSKTFDGTDRSGTFLRPG
jgi:hypothetical protein